MIVYFYKPTVVTQHGLIQECLFVECKRIEFDCQIAKVFFGESDISLVSIYDINRIE